MRDDTKNGCVADFDVDNDVRDASFVHYEALFRVGWGKGVCMSLVRISNRVVSCFEKCCCCYTIFNPSLCHLSPFHLVLCHWFKPMSLVRILP